MIQKTEAQNINILYTEEHLAEMLDTLDQLHSAASEGELHSITTLNNRELIAMLNEMIYTAQETIAEINKCAPNARPKIVLHILERPSA